MGCEPYKKQLGGIWTVTDYQNDSNSLNVDMEKWNLILPLLSRPEGVSVEIPNVKDKDYSPWGMTDNSPQIEIRFKGATQKGIIFTDGFTLIIGNKSENGEGKKDV